MPYVYEVKHAECRLFGSPLGEFVVVSADGEVRTSGWTSPALNARYYVVPPADGIQEFDFTADAPHGFVLEALFRISASTLFRAPSWLKGVRIIAEHNERECGLTGDKALAVLAPPIEVAPARAARSADGAKAARSLVEHSLASYDDSFQPTGSIRWEGLVPHVEMKKLHHTLTLVVDGPDEAKIRDCINRSLVAGVLAAIVAAYATGGLGLPAAISAFLSTLTGCLGDGFSARVDDRSYWIYWYT